MAKVYESISDQLREFIEAQQMFFVASAPLSADGHVNISPKGLDASGCSGRHRVAYLDLTGSGNETSAHLQRERADHLHVLRLRRAAAHPAAVRARRRPCSPAVTNGTTCGPLFADHPGARQIIVAEIDRVQTSCGFGVPNYDYVGQRDTLLRWADTKSEAELEAYHCEKNVKSIDGLLHRSAKASGCPSD